MTNGGMAVPDAGHDLVMLLTSHPVTIRIDAESPGPVVPDDFAGLGFERGPLNPGNAGVAGYLFRPENDSLVTLFRNMGLRNLRLGGGSVDNMFPAGADGDFTGIDNLFGFARVAGLKVIYTLRMLNRSTKPIRDLETVDAQVAGHIWSNYRDNVPASPSATSQTGTTFIRTPVVRPRPGDLRGDLGGTRTR